MTESIESVIAAFLFIAVVVAITTAMTPPDRTERLVCEGTCRGLTTHELHGKSATCKRCGTYRLRPVQGED